jgi:hypothetical protein
MSSVDIWHELFDGEVGFAGGVGFGRRVSLFLDWLATIEVDRTVFSIIAQNDSSVGTNC